MRYSNKCIVELFLKKNVINTRYIASELVNKFLEKLDKIGIDTSNVLRTEHEGYIYIDECSRLVLELNADYIYDKEINFKAFYVGDVFLDLILDNSLDNLIKHIKDHDL